MKEENNFNPVEPVTSVTPTETPIEQPQVATPVAEPVQPVQQPVMQTPVEPQPQIDPSFGTNVEVPVQPVPEPTKKKSILPLILVILVLAIGGGAAYYFLVMNKTNTTGSNETTTTTKANTLDNAKEYTLEDITGQDLDYKNVSYSTNKLILNDGKLYAIPNGSLKPSSNTIDYKGQTAYLLKENVKDVLLLKLYEEPKNTDVIVTTEDGKTFYLMVNPKNVGTTPYGTAKELEFIELAYIKNVSKGYELDNSYILVNENNQIVYSDYTRPVNTANNMQYICYDNVNKNGNNLLTNGDQLVITPNDLGNGQYRYDISKDGEVIDSVEDTLTEQYCTLADWSTGTYSFGELD